jgi:hypothetical protein
MKTEQEIKNKLTELLIESEKLTELLMDSEKLYKGSTNYYENKAKIALAKWILESSNNIFACDICKQEFNDYESYMKHKWSWKI